jgi:hypothetical protein
LPEQLREVPGDSYERIPAPTFDVPAATIARAGALTEAFAVDLRALWDGIAPSARAALLDDYRATGYRWDHPAYPFVTWAGAPLYPVEG